MKYKKPIAFGTGAGKGFEGNLDLKLNDFVKQVRSIRALTEKWKMKDSSVLE